MNNDNKTQTTQEYQMVRIAIEAHAMLKELSENEKRSMGNQTEVLIEAAYNAMKARQFSERRGVSDMHVVGV